MFSESDNALFDTSDYINHCINDMFEIIDKDITQGKLYALAGRTDDVCTLHLRDGSDVYEKFGPKVTVEFVYTQRERRLLEEDVTSLDNVPNVKAKGLVFLLDKGKDQATDLQTEGIPVKDITAAMTVHNTPQNNTYDNTEKRSLRILEVPFKAYGGGRDIGWIYGFFCRKKKDRIGFMPDDEDLYTAYRFILEKDKMSEEKQEKVIDKDGHIVLSNVGYHYLKWGEEAGLIKEQDKKILRELRRRKIRERFDVLKDELKRAGISFNLFRKNYKGQALFFLQKLYSFHDRNFNILGKHPLYMDFRSFVHIYMRHVADVNMGEQLAQKDKFQLFEKDVLFMIDHVMHEVNDDYQKFREEYPNKKYRRTGNRALYCQGDYYEVYIGIDGRLESFYKASRDKLGGAELSPSNIQDNQ